LVLVGMVVLGAGLLSTRLPGLDTSSGTAPPLRTGEGVGG
jgi:hypothetical protein